MLQIREILSESDWHPERVADHAPLPQTWWYGEAQRKRGRHVKRFEMSKETNVLGYVQFISYPLISTLSYWYAPYGPVMSHVDDDIATELRDKLMELELDKGIVFIRFDFFPALTVDCALFLSKTMTRASKVSSLGSYYQPRAEWYTDISISGDAILSAMHQKARYSVRFAEKKGVVTSIISGKDMLTHLQSFMDMMKATAKRNGFSLHDDYYYRAMFEAVAGRQSGFLVEAHHDGELLASHFIVVEGSVAHYVFGGTSDTKKDLCAPYLAHFAGMKEAKLIGATRYNFGAVSEDDSSGHWAGVTAFKKRFGGAVVAHSPYFDVVLKPFWYHVYNFRKFVKGLF